MNDQLQKLITDAEKELATLDAQYSPLKEEFDKTTDAIAPQLDRLHVLETQMDELKPRKFELEHYLEHLQKINTDFALDKRSKESPAEAEPAAAGDAPPKQA
jgi:septal ring factor EnvC (AmiA/AmiB activator)